MKKYKSEVAVDFDGVIHGYTKGWQNGEIYDEPVKGVKQALTELREKGFKIIINTARVTNNISIDKVETNWKQYHELVEWLNRYEIPFDVIVPKCIAQFYIDDRAIRFNSETYDWDDTLKAIEEYSS